MISGVAVALACWKWENGEFNSEKMGKVHPMSRTRSFLFWQDFMPMLMVTLL
jgi:hypothetical protein